MFMRYSPMRWALFMRSLIVLAVLGAAGCSGNGAVTGKVLYNGKPLPGGTVVFVTQGKGSFSSVIGSDGSYRLGSLPAGPAKVVVQGPSYPPMIPACGMLPPAWKIQNSGRLPKECANVGGNPLASAAVYMRIPEHYGHVEKSPLNYTVTSGSQEFTIPLQ